MNKVAMGHSVEQFVAKYLERRGLRFLESNYYGPQGEIDLIMEDGEYHVFVEVRFRQQDGYGSGLETVTRVKQRRLIATALHYLQKNNLCERVYSRFDVVGVTTFGKVTWVKNAFQAT